MSIIAPKYQYLTEVARSARASGFGNSTIEDKAITGRQVTVLGRTLINFGSCSYLGLEVDPRVKEEAIRAVERYGAEFSTSRSYLSLPLSDELEELLSEVFGRPTIVAATTTLAHQSAIPLSIASEDAVILDKQVHTSVRTAVKLVKAEGTHVEVIPHNDLDMLAQRAAELGKTHPQVWFMIAGIYSMYGDFAPIRELIAMLDANPQLHVYVDDAHAMAWTGFHGQGYALQCGPLHPRMLVSTSLAKGYGVCGGAIVCNDTDQRDFIRTCGDTFVFSGPPQPATLGAAIEVARILLSNEVNDLQARLRERIEFYIQRARELDLPLVSDDATPIFCLGLGPAAVAEKMCKRLLEAGFYTNLAVPPAVPRLRSGLRTTVTLHQSLDDIDRLLTTFAEEFPKLLTEENFTRDQVRESFARDAA